MMKLKLVTLTGTILDAEVYQVNIPTPQGEIGVFPDHEALVTLAVPGVLKIHYRDDSVDAQVELFAITGGIVEIANNEIKILVDEAESDEAITEEESKAALERAIKLRDEADSAVELEKAYELIDKQRIKLKVAELKRRRRKL